MACTKRHSLCTDSINAGSTFRPHIFTRVTETVQSVIYHQGSVMYIMLPPHLGVHMCCTIWWISSILARCTPERSLIRGCQTSQPGTAPPSPLHLANGQTLTPPQSGKERNRKFLIAQREGVSLSWTSLAVLWHRVWGTSEEREQGS